MILALHRIFFFVYHEISRSTKPSSFIPNCLCPRVLNYVIFKYFISCHYFLSRIFLENYLVAFVNFSRIFLKNYVYFFLLLDLISSLFFRPRALYFIHSQDCNRAKVKASNNLAPDSTSYNTGRKEMPA